MPVDLRYVILHHTGHGEPHFDLLIDHDPAAPLLTWRLPQWPLESADQAEPLPPHRRVYLEYEGPISGNRGEVRRVEEGFCRLSGGDGNITIVIGERTYQLPAG